MEKLIKRFEQELKDCREFDEDPDATSWSSEIGILITANDAKSIVEALKSPKSSGAKAKWCCLGAKHICQLNVNGGYCAAVTCQYQVQEK